MHQHSKLQTLKTLSASPSTSYTLKLIYISATMAKNLNTLFLISRRAYATTVENVVKLRSMAPIMRKVVAEPVESISPTKEVFWMRDPKTGNWVPENHFGDVDAVDLREKLLSKKTPLPQSSS